MSNVEKVAQFLKDAGTYYLATVDGDQPRVRPFGTAHVFEGRLYIQTGKKKDVARQIALNPKAELCACKGGEWLRVAAELIEDDRREARVSMLEAYPSLKALYDPDDGNTVVYYLKNAKATFSSFTAAPETVEFGGESIYDFCVPKADGTCLPLADNKGKVMLIVNTATGCGFTPHYEPLEKMYEAYHAQGLEIIDVPCNQFGGQTPGTDAEVHEFCTLHYNTQFPQMKKSDVNGENQLPLYAFLKAQQGFKGFGEGQTAAFMADMLKKFDPDYDKKPDIKWNFTKFVVDRQGSVAARFEPTADMAQVEQCVKALL